MEQIIAAVFARNTTAMGRMVCLEIRIAVVSVKRVISEKIERGMPSAIELARFLRGLSDEDLAIFVAARLERFGLIYCRRYAQFHALALALACRGIDAHLCTRRGTYAIGTRYLHPTTQVRDGIYGGSASGPSIKKRTYNHDCTFKRRGKATEGVDTAFLASVEVGQRTLCAGYTYDRDHLTATTTGAPPGTHAAATMTEDQCIVALFLLFGKNLDAFGAKDFTPAQNGANLGLLFANHQESY